MSVCVRICSCVCVFALVCAYLFLCVRICSGVCVFVLVCPPQLSEPYWHSLGPMAERHEVTVLVITLIPVWPRKLTNWQNKLRKHRKSAKLPWHHNIKSSFHLFIFSLFVFSVTRRSSIPDICHKYHKWDMWRKICHVEKFQFYIHDKCGEIWNFSTSVVWRNFRLLHMIDVENCTFGKRRLP